MQRRLLYMHRSTQATAEQVVAAEDVTRVVAQLQREGNVILEDSLHWGLSGLSTSRRSAFSVSLFCQELKALLDAGLNLVEALDALHASATDATQRSGYASVLNELRSGRSFSESLATDDRFPAVLVSAVRGGEHTGGLASALGSYLSYDQRLDDLRSRIITASVYPGIVLGLGTVIVLFLLGYVIPRFSAVYEQHASQMAVGTAWVLALGRAVNAYWIPMAALAIALAAWLAVRWEAQGRRTLIGAVRRLRPVRRLIDSFERARIYETLAVVLQGGFTVPYALDVAEGVCVASETAVALLQVRSDVESGRALHTALRDSVLDDEVAIRLAAAGAESGDMAAAMHHVGLHYGRRFARSVERLTRVVEPALLIFVGGLIGTIVLMMYMPIFDLATSVGRS